MKSSILTSFALSIIMLTGTANAQVTPELSPGLPTSYEEAVQQGASPEAYEIFADAQRNCEVNHSNDETSWRTCLATAENAYLKSVGLPDRGPALGGPIAVSTNPADSNYEYMGDDHKGFKNAND